MENKILVAIHILSAICFAIVAMSAIEKRQYLRPFVGVLIVAYGVLNVISHIRELLVMNYDLTWVFPQWYINRILSCIIILSFVYRIVYLKKQNEILKNQDHEKD